MSLSTAVPAQKDDARHIRFLTRLSLFSVLFYFVLSLLFGGLSAYYASDTLHTGLFTVSLIGNNLIAPLPFWFGCGLCGYSVLRYGARRVRGVIASFFLSVPLSVLCEFLCYVFLTEMRTAFLFYFVETPLVPISNFLILLSQNAILLFCAVIYRANHTNRQTMQVGMTKKTLFRRRNALTAVFFLFSLLVTLFSLVPAVINSVSAYRQLGFFRNIDEFLTFITPYLYILYGFFASYFTMALSGILATRVSHRIRGRV